MQFVLSAFCHVLINGSQPASQSVSHFRFHAALLRASTKMSRNYTAHWYYDTIRYEMLYVILIYRTEPTTKKWKTEKLKSKKTDMLRSIGRQSENPGEFIIII